MTATDGGNRGAASAAIFLCLRPIAIELAGVGLLAPVAGQPLVVQIEATNPTMCDGDHTVLGGASVSINTTAQSGGIPRPPVPRHRPDQKSLQLRQHL
jgi:hypothetical protein